MVRAVKYGMNVKDVVKIFEVSRKIIWNW